MPHTIDQYVADMVPVIRDDMARLSQAELTRFAQQAIVSRYSSDCPLELVSDLPANGTYFLDLPGPPNRQYGVFEPDFSTIVEIEYPIERTPREVLLDQDIQLYRRPDGWKIQIQSSAPAAPEVLRCIWTSRHDPAGSTVPEKDYFAVVDFAASLALESLAAIYVQVGDAGVSADSVNYRTKSQEYRDMAKAVRRRYFNHVGVEEGAQGAGGSDDRATIAIGDMSNVMNSGVDRLIHGRYTR